MREEWINMLDLTLIMTFILAFLALGIVIISLISKDLFFLKGIITKIFAQINFDEIPE